MTLFLPRRLLDWIDTNRGAMSRQNFIVHCMMKLVELDELKNT